MDKREISDLAYILSKIQKDPTLPKPIVFLGAGASVSAGIPMASEIVNKILKDFSGKPAIERLSKENKEDYYHLMSALSADERRDLFLSYINSEEVKINVTHIYLAQLIKEGLIDYVFTPNFDDLLLKACALFNYIPPVYDISNFNDFTTTNFQNGSITYLHGQHHGQWLLNAQGELEKVKGIIPKLFNRVCDKRTWIVVGYSGNDEVLEELAKFESFDNELYWVGYKNHEPIDKVKEKLLDVPSKNSFLISGYDSDTFFLQLHSELKLETPEIFNKPFTFIETMMEKIKDIEDYESDDEHKEKYEAVKNRFEKSKEMVKKAIETIENEPSNKLEQEIIDAIIKEDYSKINYYYNEALKNDWLRENVSEMFNNLANTISNSAKKTSEEKLYRESFEKYKIASELCPKNYTAFYNWGSMLSELALLKSDEKLYRESFEKYNIAIGMNPKYISAYNNWGLSIKNLAKQNSDEKLYKESFKKYKKVIELDSKNYTAYNNWGNTIADLAYQMKDVSLFEESFDKYEIAVKLKEDEVSAYYNWANSLSKLSRIVPEDQKSIFLLAAKEKAKISYTLDFKKSYNLACACALLDEDENALKYLEATLSNKEMTKEQVLQDDDWNTYKENEKFKEILAKY